MEDIRKVLLDERKNGYDIVSKDVCISAESFCEGYKEFLDRGKTEREAADAAEAICAEAGFVPFVRGMKLTPGTKVYAVNRGRAFACAVIGSESLEKGANIAASHIDSPRIDLKPVPLYEDSDIAYFKTHYYGGIKKYQWVTIPLELHGVMFNKDGERIDVNVGGSEEDPVFVITDILPHLGREQAQKPLGTAFTGENLNVVAGGAPYADEGSDRVKLSVLSVLNEMYDVTERDFLSSELSFVPAGKARDVGFDRSFIGSYGHDDRVCAYGSLLALTESKEIPARTSICFLADKEEIGSEGVSSMKSGWFDTFMSDLCDSQGVDYRVFCENSCCLSADVGAAYDPNFPEAFEKRNCAVVNGGVVVMKYTGSGGKGSASDASAELVSKIRCAFDRDGVLWQMGELGKVDYGGGGTVAKYVANRNIDTLDIGVPLLSMHAPFELAAKLDIYMMYLASKSFFTL
ncbi:MAG: aminopeptidase [Oscillospiraceae bacterium]|nr:aminopeptidase [Oscillospiraceae bacterium]